MRQRVFQYAIERYFAERAARFCSAENGLQSLRRLRKVLARLVHFANSLAHLEKHSGGRFQALRHFPLGLRREIPGGGDSGQQLLPDLAKLLGHRLHQMVDLSRGGLALRCERALHFLAHSGQLCLRPAARRPHDECQ